jgi:hypothetical protein
MTKWNGHYKDYDYSDPSYTLKMLTGIREYTERNVEWAKEHKDISALDYFLPKLAALNVAIRAISE